jgi:methylmalonyl-CoA/ethylmalonyl-CoA epimerase
LPRFFLADKQPVPGLKPSNFHGLNNRTNQINYLMKPSHIEHLGIAVNSLEEAIPFYEKILGTKCYSIEEVPEQKVKTAFFKIGQTKIELLEPTDPDSAVGTFLANRGQGVHHVAFEVDGLQNVLNEVAEGGIRLIDKAPRGGAEGLNIAFLHPKSTFGVLMELCENPNK